MTDSSSPADRSESEDSRPEVSLASKIDFLFSNMHPAGRGPYSLQDAADGITRLTGEKISHNALWKLRNGLTDNPTKRTLEGLARFFGVNPAYFFDDEASAAIENQVELLGMLRDTGVRGVQLRSFFALSPDAQSMIADLIESTARLEDEHRKRRQPPRRGGHGARPGA